MSFASLDGGPRLFFVLLPLAALLGAGVAYSIARARRPATTERAVGDEDAAESLNSPSKLPLRSLLLGALLGAISLLGVALAAAPLSLRRMRPDVFSLVEEAAAGCVSIRRAPDGTDRFARWAYTIAPAERPIPEALRTGRSSVRACSNDSDVATLLGEVRQRFGREAAYRAALTLRSVDLALPHATESEAASLASRAARFDEALRAFGESPAPSHAAEQRMWLRARLFSLRRPPSGVTEEGIVRAGSDASALPERDRETARCLLQARYAAGDRARVRLASTGNRLAIVRAMLQSESPGCRVLGATFRGLDGALAAQSLEAIRDRAGARWRSLIDAARRWLLSSQRWTTASPRDDEAPGVLDVALLERAPLLALELLSISYALEAQGRLWLSEQTRTAALQALAKSYVIAPMSERYASFEGTPSRDPLPTDARWILYAAHGQQQALASLDDARARDPRFDRRHRERTLAWASQNNSALSWRALWLSSLHDREELVALGRATIVDLERRGALSQELSARDTAATEVRRFALHASYNAGAIHGPFTHVALQRAHEAYNADRPQSDLRTTLGAPTLTSVRIAHVLSYHRGRTDALALWLWNALLDEPASLRPLHERYQIARHIELSALLLREDALAAQARAAATSLFTALHEVDPFITTVLEVMSE